MFKSNHIKIKNCQKLIAVLFSILLFTNCQKDNFIDAPSEEIVQKGTYIEYVSDVEVPEIINSITSLTGSTSLKIFPQSKSIRYKKAIIDLNKILKVKNKDNITNYTFGIEVADAPVNEFYNLVVNENPSGKVKKPYVVKFVVDDDALDNFIRHKGDFDYFKGMKYLIPFSRFFDKKDVNITKSGDCPTDGAPINNINSGGSGGFRDIGPDNYIQTDVNRYDYADYTAAGQTFTIYFNSYEDNTSFGEEVILRNTAVNISAPSVGISPFEIFLVIGGDISSISISGSSGTPCVWTLIKKDGLDKTTYTEWHCVQTQKNGFITKGTSDCPEESGEVGVVPIKGNCNFHGGDNVEFYDGLCYPVQIFDTELSGIARCIYDKLNNSSTGFRNAIQKFDGEFPVSHLTFEINNSLPKGNYGVTNPPNNFNITIEISNNQLSFLSDVGGAVAFAHEVIHAEIYRKMLSAAQKGDLNHEQYTTEERINYVDSLRNNFFGLYDYYWDNYKPAWNHNMMAEHYRSIIADIVEEFDNFSLSRQTYEDIAWGGLIKLETLNNSIAWDNLTSAEQQRINTNLTNIFFGGATNCN